MGPALRPTLGLAAALVLGTGCGQRDPESCPGVTLAALQLHAALVSTDCVAPPASWPWAPPSLWPAPGVSTDLPADPGATFAASWAATAGDGVAYCAGGAHAAPLLGDRAGSHVRAARTLARGAVLSACGADCKPQTTVTVEGELFLDSADAPASFSGTLTEALEAEPADCGRCVVPCASTYTLVGGS
jgi:hypothetical protein